MVSLILPTLNEAATVAAVIAKAKPFVDEILVIDGHSTDGTRAEALRAGAEVHLDHGRGKGDAVRVGFQRARGDVFVTMDSDGSHDPSDIPRLVQALRDGGYALVVGSRITGGSAELSGNLDRFLRRMGNRTITAGINWRFRQRLTDSQNGFRALRADVARTLDLREEITTIEQEMIFKVLARGGRVGEVPTFEAEREVGLSRIELRKVAWAYFWCWVRHLVL